MDGLECSEIKKSELEFSGRTDAEYYQKKFLQYQNIIEAHNILPLSKVADFLIGPFGSAYDKCASAETLTATIMCTDKSYRTKVDKGYAPINVSVDYSAILMAIVSLVYQLCISIEKRIIS